MKRSELERLEQHLAARIREVLPEKESKQGDPDEKWYKYRQQADGQFFTVLKVFTRPDVVGEGMPYIVDATRLEKYMQLTPRELTAVLPPGPIVADENVSNWRQRFRDNTRDARGFKGYFTSTEQIDTFINGLKNAQQNNQKKE